MSRTQLSSNEWALLSELNEHTRLFVIHEMTQKMELFECGEGTLPNLEYVVCLAIDRKVEEANINVESKVEAKGAEKVEAKGADPEGADIPLTKNELKYKRLLFYEKNVK
jgi:hypothetical protein